jgi:N-methylhydantoinase A/oxoprolinase/acetone carboxylase beta subunit
MNISLAHVSVAALIAIGLCTIALPQDAEAKVRFRSRTHHTTSSEDTQQSAEAAQKQAEEQAAAAARAQKANDEAREKRAVEMRERNAVNDAKMKEVREARLEAQRKRIEAAHAKNVQKETPAKTAVAAEVPKPAPLKMTSYKDENGTTHFTDGTDSATQARQRKR